MEAKDRTSIEEVVTPGLDCSECLEPALNPAFNRDGGPLCLECATRYYAPCAGCGGLAAIDEAIKREEAIYCPDCFSKADLAPGQLAPDDEELASLVREYLALHAEEKRVGDRLKQVKEQLKIAASTRQRISNAVTFAGEEGSVRCRYSVKLKCDPEKVAVVESMLDPEEFASIFERKISFTPLQDSLEEFLARTDEATRSAREAISGALERVETASLVVLARK